jgi:hypothetical protein
MRRSLAELSSSELREAGNKARAGRQLGDKQAGFLVGKALEADNRVSLKTRLENVMSV